MIDHQETPLADHLDAYLDHLKAKGDSDVHLADTRRLGDNDHRRIVASTGSPTFAAKPSKAGLCNGQPKAWPPGPAIPTCRRSGACATGPSKRAGLPSIPLARIAKADEKADRRRQRRALTEDELRRLLDVARRRPLPSMAG